MDDFPTISNLVWTQHCDKLKKPTKKTKVEEARPTLVIPTHLGPGFTIIRECEEKWATGKSNAWEAEIAILSNILKCINHNGTLQDKHDAEKHAKELEEIAVSQSDQPLKNLGYRMRASFNNNFMLWPPLNSSNWVNQHTTADGIVTDVPMPRSTYIRMGIGQRGKVRGIQQKAYEEAAKAFELQKLSYICNIAKHQEDATQGGV